VIVPGFGDTQFNAKIIDGKRLSQLIKNRLHTEIEDIPGTSRVPTLAVLVVGNDPASEIYVRNKRKACDEIGMQSMEEHLPHSASTFDVLDAVWNLNNISHVDGIIVQLPLPEHVNVNKVIEAIDVSKDVDGFHPYNVGRLATRNPFLRPCTPFGIMHLIQSTGEPIKGKHAVIVGASNLVGRPLALELLLDGATVTVCHKFTEELQYHTRMADILISATGFPEIITKDMVKSGAIVIDVGISRLKDGSLCGDVMFDEVKEVASYITPVPGGVGPMTVAMLLSNTMQSYKIREKELKDLK